MYFSLISSIPGQERDAAHERLRGAYFEHQWLWNFFPAVTGTTRDFQFRRHDLDGLLRFYVVSRSAPVSPFRSWQVQSKRYAPSLAADDCFVFELRANPVITSRDASGKAARHDVVMWEKTRLLRERNLARWADWLTSDRPTLPDLVERKCGEWLKARCQRLGISVDDQTLRADGYLQHRGKNGELKFSTIDFSGQLRVVDPAALQAALFYGVGHAKAFGCGLLLIRPLG